MSGHVLEPALEVLCDLRLLRDVEEWIFLTERFS
jgi:hypothetical protein